MRQKLYPVLFSFFAFSFLWAGVASAQQKLSLQQGQWRHFLVNLEGWESSAVFELRAITGNPDLYVRFGQAPPTLTNWDFRSTETPQLGMSLSQGGSPAHDSIVLDDDSDPAMENGPCFYSVYAATDTTFVVSSRIESTVSSIPGMGAIPHEGGTTFRTWAPNADSVHVAGSFNGFSSDTAEMQSEGNGIWSINFRGVGPGARYKYVIRNGDQTLWRNDPRARQLTNSVGDSVVANRDFAWTDQDFSIPNWNEMVIYQMHIGTINDEPGGGPGNFDDAINRLDEIADLGANAVKLLPVNEFAGDFSWGYNPAYPFSVESAYGGPDAFKRFVNAAHERGIAVLLDLVHNHYGPQDMDMWRYDGFFEDIFGGIFFYQDERSFTQWGDTRPDFGRGEVRQYIRDNAIDWITEFHVDGFRWDSTLNIRRTDLGDNPDGWSLMQWINNEIDAVKPGALSVAEDLQGNSYITKTTGAGGAGFDSQWTPDFVHPIRNVIVPPSDDGRNMFDVKNSIEQRYNGDAFQRVIYTESHDEVANGRSRVPEEIFPGNADSYWSQKRSTLGAALVMTSPGIPMIFQGQELLEDGFFQDTDPVDWSRLKSQAGIRQLYTDLIRLRRNWFNNTRGLRGQNVNVFHVNNDDNDPEANNDKMIAFHRWQDGGAGDDVIVICNFRNRSWNKYRIGFPRSGTWKVRFNSDWEGYSDDFSNFFSPDVTTLNQPRDGLPFSGVIEIGPYSTLILSQD